MKNTKKGSVALIGVFIGLIVVAGSTLFITTQKDTKNNQITDTQETNEIPDQVRDDKSVRGDKEEVFEMTGEELLEDKILDQVQDDSDTQKEIIDSGKREMITLAGGCFWCIESFYQEEAGVVDAISGYAGGSSDDASYKLVAKGKTAHREAVQVTYDPEQISTEKIIDIFWTQIDPTDPSGQFADRGFQYTTAIFYHNEAQRVLAEASKERLGESGLFEGKEIVTEIVPYTIFFEAEAYHQDYYKKAADHYKRYEAASGRKGFKEDTWARDAALLFLETADSEQNTEVNSGKWLVTSAALEPLLAELDPSSLTYKVVVKKGTEKPFDNAYWDNTAAGLYVDVVTGEPLFSSTHKYRSGTGWPSFWRTLDDTSITLHDDYKLFVKRTEVRSQAGHLGHVFNDGPVDKGGKRWCMNSAALNLIPLEELVEKGYGDYLYLFE